MTLAMIERTPMLKVMAMSGAIVSLLASPLSATQDSSEVVPMASVAVEVAAINGSGCPAGTATTSFSPNTGALSVNYDEFFVWKGDGSEVTDYRRNCQLSLQVKAPKGWTYTLSGAENRGYAYLVEGVNAVQATSYYFQAGSSTVTSKHPISSPYRGYWKTVDTAANLDDLGFAPCDAQRNVNVNTEIRVSGGTLDAFRTSFVTMESTVVYKLALARCN
jgi:hypothetical protein